MIWKQAGSWHTIWSAKLFTKMLKFNSGCDVKIHHKAETQDKNPWQDFLHPMLQLFGVFTVWVWSFNRWAFLNSFGKKIHNSQRSWVDLTLFDIIYITKSFSQYFALKTFWGGKLVHFNVVNIYVKNYWLCGYGSPVGKIVGLSFIFFGALVSALKPRFFQKCWLDCFH